MAHISGVAAALYSEVVQSVGAATAFSVGQTVTNAKGKPFTALTNSDTIGYKAVAMDDPTKWEIGLGTYVSASSTLTRTTISASSNSNSAVNFGATGQGGNVKLEGLVGSPAAYAVTAFTADRSLAGTESGAANVAATLATVINDLIAAGIFSGTVAA